MVGELLRRQQELQLMLTKKDKEIQDFRDQGHKVSRSKGKAEEVILHWGLKWFTGRQVLSELFTCDNPYPFQTQIHMLLLLLFFGWIEYLETTTFSPKTFEAEMCSSVAFEESARLDVQVFSNPTCQSLYNDVTRMRTLAAERKGTVC